mgnify:CR=1 FL=1
MENLVAKSILVFDWDLCNLVWITQLHKCFVLFSSLPHIISFMGTIFFLRQISHNYNNNKFISYNFIIARCFRNISLSSKNVFVLEDASFRRYHFQHLLGKCNSSNDFSVTHDDSYVVIMSLSKLQILAILHIYINIFHSICYINYILPMHIQGF